MIGNVFSFLPIILIIGAFWAITKKRRVAAKLVKRKDDIWYVLKEYLKLSGRSGARVADLSLYPRAQTISSLREYIKSTREFLEEERNKAFSIKKKKSLAKFSPLKRKNRESYPEKEMYHRNLELKTLEIIAEKNSYFREYLESYRALLESEKFRTLISNKLIGESMIKVTKHRKKIVQRNRYLVCFRLYEPKKTSKHPELTDWEAIEIELFKNPKREDGKKYKILYTASLQYKEELHWIYALQRKYLKDKILANRRRDDEKKEAERRIKNKALLLKVVNFPLLISKKLGHKVEKE